MRAHFTICPERPAGSDYVDPRRSNSKVKRGRPPGPRMKCGRGRGAQLTGHQMRAHFTIYPERPTASDRVDRRWKNSTSKRGRPPGRRMPCGWRCAAQLTASRIRRISPGPRMLCGRGCGAQLTGSHMRALHHMPEAAGGLRRRGATNAVAEPRSIRVLRSDCRRAVVSSEDSLITVPLNSKMPWNDELRTYADAGGHRVH
jgi:hypothetical protein